MTRHWKAWLVIGLVAALVAAALARVLLERRAGQAAPQSVTAGSAPSTVELASTDVVQTQLREMVRGLPVSGSLRAVDSAVVKARVSGELRGLVVREGDFVRAGQVIARIDDSDYQTRVRQATEQAASSRAQVEVAQRQYDNNRALVEQGFISKTALDTSQASLNAARSAYQALLAATDLARQSVADTVLKSPINGQVSQRFAQPGERVGIDARIVEIVDLRRLELEASLSAADSVQVRVGQTAELQIEGKSQAVKATVSRINPSAQAGSRSVLAYLSLDPEAGRDPASPANPTNAPALRQGLFVQGTLNTARDALLALPVSAVRTDQPLPYVQAVEGGRIVHRPVQLGERGSSTGETVVGVSGVAENTTVVRGHIGTLREGTRVVFTPMTRAPAGAAAPARSAP